MIGLEYLMYVLNSYTVKFNKKSPNIIIYYTINRKFIILYKFIQFSHKKMNLISNIKL